MTRLLYVIMPSYRIILNGICGAMVMRYEHDDEARRGAYVGIYDNQLDIDGPNQVLLSQVKTK